MVLDQFSEPLDAHGGTNASMDINNYTPENITAYMVSCQLESKANTPPHLDTITGKTTMSTNGKGTQGLEQR